MSNPKPAPGPRLRRGLHVFYGICGILVLLDLTGLRHAEAPFDGFWGFYPLYGFVACVILVLVAKGMRRFLMRDEDYYRRGEDD